MTIRHLLALFMLLVGCSLARADWPQFRGGTASGVSTVKNVPTKWDVKTNENIAWTTEIPGRGPASPIVVGKRIFVTASSGANQDRMHVLCYDSDSGKELWQRQFWATGRCYSHSQSANAAPTPASDGERIYAFYSSNDLVCLDLEGNLLWYRGLTHDYPKAANDVGMSASPLVVDQTVIVQIENQGDSFAAGINALTGETRWRIARDPEACWTSPTLLPGKDGNSLVLLQSPKRLTALEPATGKLVWEKKVECQGIPSPAVYGDRIFLPANGLLALDAPSRLAEASNAWAAQKLGPGAASPVCNGDYVFTINRAPVLTCASAKTGEIVWQHRLKGAFWATPLIIGDLLYCVNFDGTCLVVKLGAEKGETIATNEFVEAIQASPAPIENGLIFRSDKHLWKVAEKK